MVDDSGGLDGAEALGFDQTAFDPLRLGHLPDLPVDLARLQVVGQRLDAPHLDTVDGRRRRCRGQPGQHGLLLVDDDTERGEPVADVHGGRRIADPPGQVAKPAAPGLRACPVDGGRNIAEPHPMDAGAARSCDVDESVALDRLERGPGQEIQRRLLGELVERGCRHASTLPARYAPRDDARRPSHDRRDRRTGSREADQPLDLGRPLRRPLWPLRAGLQPGDGRADRCGRLRDGRGGRPGGPGGEGGVSGLAGAVAREARGALLRDPRAVPRAARGDREAS